MNAPPSPTLSGCRVGLLTASASRLGGGVFEAVVLQAQIVRDLGGEVEVFTLQDAHTRADSVRFDAPVHSFPVLGPRQIGFAPGLVRGLLDAELDCLHLHGIWMYPSAAGAAWARRTGRAYFVSPHGMLDPWITARSRWRKRAARLGYEQRSWRRATRLHALTAAEAGDVGRETGRNDALIIPNASPEALATPAPAGPPTAVYVGRVHAKKNLLALVQGWFAARRPEGSRLVVAGWGAEADVDLLRREIANGDGSAVYVGPVHGARKDKLLDSARWIVLPSLSEGLPMAVLEAWARGRPTIMTAGCNLPEGFTAGAALACGTDRSSIARALEEALGLDESAWQTMSEAAVRLSATTFARETVARQWARAYSTAIAQQGRRPR